MARMITREETLTTSNIVTASNSSAISVARAKSISIQCVVDVNTPAAKTFVDGDVDVNANTITITSHSFTTTGLKVTASTNGVLPAGLSAGDYFVIVVDANTIKLASSLVNALAGTAIDITAAAGGGTHTLTPVAIAGGTVGLQKSNDGSTWDVVTTATAVTADGDIWLADTDPTYKYVRLSYALTAGRLSASNYVIVKEDR